jgi:integrase
MDFKDDITKAKPNISAGSLKTYNSLLRTIYKAVIKSVDKPNVKMFSKHADDILKFLEAKPFGVRKTYLAALVAVAPLEEYKKMMLSDIRDYQHEQSKSELTTKLENSAISKEEIDEIADKLRQNAEALFKKKTHRVSDLMDIQNYVILSLYYDNIVPRRALDYCDMLYKNYDETNNYIDFKKNRFVFNNYKTAKYKGTQYLDIPPALMKILKKWIALIPKEIDNLFFNSNLEPLSNVTLNQRLNVIFGGAKSVNALRHFYLTSKYSDLMRETEEMAKEMEAMGSSKAQANTYIKIHDKEKE